MDAKSEHVTSPTVSSNELTKSKSEVPKFL